MKNKKYITLLSVLTVCTLILSLSSCKKKKENFPIHPEPAWSVTHEDYSVSMTAVVQLPDHLKQYAQDNDHIAAFSDNVCRGIGDLVEDVYYLTIKGTPDEETGIYFQYYSGRNKYLYTTPVLLQFESDAVYGTVDEPNTLPLVVVE